MQSFKGSCQTGNISVLTEGIASTNPMQGSFPSCLVTVNIHGGGLATIFSDNGITPLSNPFTAGSNGAYFFYAANGRYDVIISGGGLPSPVTLADVLLQDIATFAAFTEQVAPAGQAGVDILYGDSSAHRLKMINNNAAADVVVGANTVDTLAGKTISSGTFTGTSTFSGPIAAGANAVSGGPISGTTGTFSGAVSSGAFSATTGTFSGAISAPSVAISGNETVGGTLGVTGVSTLGTVSAANVSVANSARDCRIDGVIDLTNTNDDAAVINTCIVNALTNKQSKVILPCGFLKISSAAINASNAYGLAIEGCASTVTFAGATKPLYGTILMCNTGTQCMEAEGSGSFKLRNVTMVLNGSLGGQSISTPTRIGLIVGRDNDNTGLAGGTGGGSGANNDFCFQEQWELNNVAIVNMGAANGALNGTNAAGGGRGYVPFYNAGGAENGQVINCYFLGGTPMVGSTTEILSASGTYHPLVTGCPTSLSRVAFVNTLFQQDGGAAGTNPAIELNNSFGYDFIGVDWLGGNAAFLFTGSASNIQVTGQQENVNATSYFIESTCSIIGGRFEIVPGAPTAHFNPLTNNLGFAELYFSAGESAVPLCTNTATGTAFNLSHLHFNNGSLNLSNVTISACDLYVSSLTGCGTVHAGSSYRLHTTANGVFDCGGFNVTGQVLAAQGGGSTPGYAFTGDPTTGIWDNGGGEIDLTVSSNTAGWRFLASGEFRTGSGSNITFSSNANPFAAGGDTNISRSAAGVTAFGTGAQGSTAGTVAATIVQITSSLFANLGTPANGQVKFCSDCTIANPCAGGGTGAIAKRLNNVWVCN